MASRILLALVLSSPFWGLGHPLWETDDARYAEVPREMVELGDWLTPRLDYFDYVEKPPLIYWLPALSYKAFGVSEAAARLPNALLALAGLLGVWWLGSWLLSPSAGRWAAVLLGTCFQFFLLGRLLTPDMALSVFLLWATAAALRCLKRPEDARWAGPLAWTCMALAVLSKGLIAVLLPGLWTALLLLFFPGLRRGLKGLLLNWGLPAFLLIVGAWFAAMERRHPGFFHFFVVEQHFQRYLTPKYSRPGPWYYFFGVDAAGTLPWMPLFWAGTALPFLRWKEAGESSEARRQLALWVAAVFAFFSASSSKLPTYILPLFAHQALLAGDLLARTSDEEGALKRWLQSAAWPLAALFALAALTGPFLAPRLAPAHLQLSPAALWAASAFAMLQALALASLALRAPLKAAALACAANALALVAAQGAEPLLSVKALSADIAARYAPGDRILCYDKYLHGIAFYVRKPVDVVNWVGELHYAKRDPRYQARFGDDDAIRNLDARRTNFVVLEAKLLEHLKTLRPPGSLKRVAAYGSWILVEI